MGLNDVFNGIIGSTNSVLNLTLVGGGLYLLSKKDKFSKAAGIALTGMGLYKVGSLGSPSSSVTVPSSPLPKDHDDQIDDQEVTDLEDFPQIIQDVQTAFKPPTVLDYAQWATPIGGFINFLKNDYPASIPQWINKVWSITPMGVGSMIGSSLSKLFGGR